MPTLVTTGTTASPASPAMRNPTATSCSVVFHLASRVTGTLTRNSARYSRKPDTRISRQRITTAAKSAQLVTVCDIKPAPERRSDHVRGALPRMPACRCAQRPEPHYRAPRSRRPLVKEFIDPSCCFCTDTIHLHQIRDRGALDRLERA